MSTIPQKDRVSLCRYTFSDQRQCRTPRSPHHPHFCFYHARLESQSGASAKLADDIEYFFSGKYVSANDLAKVLARILPAIIRGDIKPRLAKTIAYLAQTLNQTIQLAQHEYINTYGTNAWRDIIDTNITLNSDFDAGEPLDEAGVQTEDVSDISPRDSEDSAPDSEVCHPERSDPQSRSDREGPASSSSAEVELSEVSTDNAPADSDQQENQNHPPLQNQAEPAQETQEKDQREVVFTESKGQDKRKPEAA
jgi:hypothetical protein